jgi:hypothetical protein
LIDGSIYVSIYLSVYISIYLFTYLYTYLSPAIYIYLSIDLFNIYPFISFSLSLNTIHYDRLHSHSGDIDDVAQQWMAVMIDDRKVLRGQTQYHVIYKGADEPPTWIDGGDKGWRANHKQIVREFDEKVASGQPPSPFRKRQRHDAESKGGVKRRRKQRRR